MRFLHPFRKKLLSWFLGFDGIQNFLDATNDPIFILYQGELIKNFNRQVTELFGYDKHDLLGRSGLLKLIHKEHIPLLPRQKKKSWKSRLRIQVQ